MYRLILYYLFALIFLAAILSLFGLMPFGILQLVISFLILTGVCHYSNKLFAKIFHAEVNLESAYITAFILTLIVTPQGPTGYFVVILIGLFAMASKYLIAIRKQHIFNPAAFAVALAVYTLNDGASWWVGNIWMLPAVIIGGLLLTRKIQRESMVLAFVVTTLVFTIIFSFTSGIPIPENLARTFVYSSTLFFAFVMLTEPSTSPTTKKRRILFALLVAILISPSLRLGNFYFTPELALVTANLISFIIWPKARYKLTLKEKIKIAPDIYDFVFEADKKINFLPGQYLEWTLPAGNSDLRGNRRYFTIASSPTERLVRLGTKFYEKPSTFKQKLLSIEHGAKISAAQLNGEFVLPKNPNQKLVFIAGGIGITPFRSIIKYLLDTNQRRPVTMFFSNKTKEDIVYADLFFDASEKLGIDIIYTLTEKDKIPVVWKGEIGFVDENMLAKYLSGYKDYVYYISGTHQMVTAMEEMLSKMQIPKKQIKKDFFPGYV